MHLALLIALALAVPAAAPKVDERALDDLLNGVETLDAPGQPGNVVAFGPEAFVVLVDRGGMPVVAAGEAGKGRVLILGHGGYLGRAALERHDTARFMTNALRWVSGGKRRPKVAAPWNKDSAAAFDDLVLATSADADWTGADVVVVDLGADRSWAELEQLRTFVAEGGGLLAACTGWGWQQLNADRVLARDLFGNRLLEPFGLCFGTRVSAPEEGAFPVRGPGPWAHAGRALAALEAGELEAGPDRAGAVARVRAALEALSDHEPLLMLPLRDLLEGGTDPAGLTAELEAAHAARALRPRGERWEPWQVVGPFKSAKADVTARGPLDARLARFRFEGQGPDRAKAFKGRGGKHRWAPLEVAGDGRGLDVGTVRLDKQLAAAAGKEGLERSVAYLTRRVVVEAPFERALQLEASGGLELWVDGHSVLRRVEPIPVGVERTDLVLSLDPGVHHLFVKLTHERGVWSFRASPTQGRLETGAVDAAVARGIEYLTRHQLVDGSWPGYEGYGPGLTAFALYALLKSGAPRDDPIVQRAWAYVDAHPANHTYSLGSKLLAGFAYERGDPGEALVADVERLIEMRESSGIWSYPVHPDGNRLPEDLSTTLYAALALKAAHERGIEIPAEVWVGLIEGTLTCWRGDEDEPRAGFSYRTRRTDPNAAATGSMTGAGLSILWIARDGLGGRLERSLSKELELALEGGLGWLEDRMVFDENPGNANFQLFHVYGIERTGELLGLDLLGGVPWYTAGARYLVQAQDEDGSWKSKGYGQAVRDTALALLFLRRATRPRSGRAPAQDAVLSAAGAGDARLGVIGRGPFDAWIAELSEAARDAHGSGKRRAVPIERVRYFAERPTHVGRAERIELAAVARRTGVEVQRFEARVELPGPGRWTLWAELDLATGDLSTGQTATTLRSGDLELAYDGEQATPLEYAAQGRDNLLRGRSFTCEASSPAGAARVRAAADGLQSSAWVTDAGDLERRWSLELERGVDARRLALSHASPGWYDPGRVRATAVEVSVNGDPLGRFELAPDPRRKTFIDLGGQRRVTGLELRLLGPAELAAGASLGLAEVELLAE